MSVFSNRRGYSAVGMLLPLLLVIGTIAAVFVPAYRELSEGGKRLVRILLLATQAVAFIGAAGFCFWRSTKPRAK